ncbi:hypothetical protein HNY73_006975 [Argiope bruennichi]|uniref:Uncharacterized protein n=1 Tax=Argiope bruennichi TaxID=94029 RepID=A0A8T0FJL1_ARGBR|nr:hypothetical protein HNY73_006975 [Argiope bruennichi]
MEWNQFSDPQICGRVPVTRRPFDYLLLTGREGEAWINSWNSLSSEIEGHMIMPAVYKNSGWLKKKYGETGNQFGSGMGGLWVRREHAFQIEISSIKWP